MKSLLLGLMCCVFAPFLVAGEREGSGTVTLVASSGYIFVNTSNANSGCGNKYWFIPDDDYKKAMFSMLLAAQISGKRVWVNGQGECKSDYPFNNAYELANMLLYTD